MPEISINALLSEATRWDGYLEKKSVSNLDELTANAGNGNYTCFGRDYDELMNTHKNGYAWCAMYASMMFVYAFGFEKAKEIIGGNLYCSCTTWFNTLKSKDRIVNYPQSGDLIFFTGTTSNKSGHVGIVTSVQGNYVYTIEGNTSSTGGMIANGGCVRQKSYKLDYNKIKGYGRPLYDNFITAMVTNTPNKGVFSVMLELPLLQKGSKGKAVGTLQILLNSEGYRGKDGKILAIDEQFGDNCSYALYNYQSDHVECGKPDSKCGAKTWACLLGIS